MSKPKSTDTTAAYRGLFNKETPTQQTRKAVSKRGSTRGYSVVTTIGADLSFLPETEPESEGDDT